MPTDTEMPDFDGPVWLRKTAMEALDEYAACKKRGIPYPCRHDRLNEDGYCRQCGADCRGIGGS